MNCERFQMVAEDLAREEKLGAPEGDLRGLMVMDTNERAIALEHIATCEPCAQTLNEQKELSESLHDLAEQMRILQAPPRLEVKLMAAQRTLAQSRTLRSSSPRRLSWITAVAALLLLVLGLMVWRWRPNSQPSEPMEAKSNSASEPATSSAGARQAVSAPVAANPPSDPSASGIRKRRDTLPKRVNYRASRSGRLFLAAQVAKRRKEEHEQKQQQQAPAANAEPAEVATDFVPVGYGSALDLQEGGQLVRVELPRLALASFGLPVNMDRVDERVKADVLVGPDGFARAIRFVK